MQENYLNHRPNIARDDATRLRAIAKAADAFSIGDVVNRCCGHPWRLWMSEQHVVSDCLGHAPNAESCAAAPLCCATDIDCPAVCSSRFRSCSATASHILCWSCFARVEALPIADCGTLLDGQGGTAVRQLGPHALCRHGGKCTAGLLHEGHARDLQPVSRRAQLSQVGASSLNRSVCNVDALLQTASGASHRQKGIVCRAEAF